jgi:DNA-binding MarR family transcriptional regulator
MIERTLTSLAEFANAVVRGFMLPGDLLLAAFAWVAPQTAEILTFGNGKTIFIFVLAMIGWTIIVIVGLLISRMCRRFLQQIGALVRILVWNAKMYLGNLKTKMLWKYREFFPHKADEAQTVSQEQFDDLDIAVLASVSRGGPESTSSAKELAKKYRVKSAEIQDRLDRLAQNHMLDPVRNSRWGGKSYRLTESGLALIAMCERQAAQRSNLTSAVQP